MSRFPTGIFTWTPGIVSPSIPWVDDPGPGDEPPTVPDQPGAQGEDYLVAVQSFPRGGDPVVLWGARVTSMPTKDFRLGANSCTVEVPTTPENMRILGLEMSEFDSVGRHLYSVSGGLAWELLIGSTLDGAIRRRFVVRDEIEASGSMVTITGTGYVNGVTADRMIGAAERVNLLGNSSFESGTLAGWTLVSDGQRLDLSTAEGSIVDANGEFIAAGVIPGGVDGKFKVWVRGTPDRLHYIERRHRWPEVPHPWGRTRIAGTSYVQLPEPGIDIDDFGLVSVGVEYADGTPFWPVGGPAGEDPEAAQVDTDMARGAFDRDQVVAIGWLPPPPFEVDVCIRLHPTDETRRTYYDGPQIIRRENTSTFYSVDLVEHVTKLLAHAQKGLQKSPWFVRVIEGAPTGTEERGTWWHDEHRSLNDALGELNTRGVEMWDRAGPGRRIVASANRGAQRLELQVNEWDLLGVVKWRIDPGTQRSGLVAVSGANSVWGGADVGALDTSSSFGQVIDVVMTAPVGMTPRRLQQWADNQLGSLKLVQTTATLLLPWNLGQRLSVGDSIIVAARAGSAALKGWHRITQSAPDFDGRFVAIDVGNDPEPAR